MSTFAKDFGAFFTKFRLSVNVSPESDSNVGDLESDINVGEDRNESLNSFSISPESHSDVNGRAELELGSYNVSLSPETSTHSETSE